MTQQAEKLWVYDAVEPGQAGNPTTVTLTPEHISRYAWAAQNPDARYYAAGANAEFGGRLVAMPTTVVAYAPLLREDIAQRNGFVAQEDSKTARRQTPFAKCEIRWFAPVFAGDTLTATRRVLEKYERRGSKFVAIRVEAANQRGEKVAHYDYTCIFEYVQGQRAAAPAPGQARPKLPNPPQPVPVAPAFSTFAGVSVGAALRHISLSESEEVILAKNEVRLTGHYRASNIHTDEEFARRNIFGGAVNSGPATMSYVDQMLAWNFPLRAFYHGGGLVLRAITPFKAGDTVTFQGEVTGKREEGSQKLAECRVKGVNQRGDLVCLADALLVMPE